MRYATYIYGLACVSLALFGVAYFIFLFTLTPLANLLPPSIVKPVVYGTFVIPSLIALAYFIRSVLKCKNNGIPDSFKGWRYIITVSGFCVLILGAMPVIIALFSRPATGGMSGVPLGLGVFFSFMLVLPAMATKRK